MSAAPRAFYLHLIRTGPIPDLTKSVTVVMRVTRRADASSVFVFASSFPGGAEFPVSISRAHLDAPHCVSVLQQALGIAYTDDVHPLSY